jgi:F-type H+-transporting ATPase subunit delta
LIRSYIAIITNKKRESLIPAISQSFIKLYKKHLNIQEATVITSSKISQKIKDKVVSYIKQQGAQKVELNEVVDKSIIGGAIIRIDDKQLDLSVASEISELRQMFNKNLYLQN